MIQVSERDREMAKACVKRLHPIDTRLNLEPQIEHVALYLAQARAEGAGSEESLDFADLAKPQRSFLGTTP